MSSLYGHHVLKSVQNHPLSSTEFDSATETALDTDDIPSCEDVIDDGSSSIKSGGKNIFKNVNLLCINFHRFLSL